MIVEWRMVAPNSIAGRGKERKARGNKARALLVQPLVGSRSGGRDRLQGV